MRGVLKAKLILASTIKVDRKTAWFEIFYECIWIVCPPIQKVCSIYFDLFLQATIRWVDTLPKPWRPVRLRERTFHGQCKNTGMIGDRRKFILMTKCDLQCCMATRRFPCECTSVARCDSRKMCINMRDLILHKIIFITWRLHAKFFSRFIFLRVGAASFMQVL